MGDVLEARALSAGYGSIPVLSDVTLTVGAGEVVALLGPNGAGKTTTLLTLAGEIHPFSGETRFNGKSTTAPLHRRAKQGLAFVTEERSVFMALTTADNLRVGGVDPAFVLELFPELESRMNVKAGLLSGGEQQMLTLGRALARRPTALLADELSMGLAPLAVDRLHRAVRVAATEHGVGVLLVEQQVRKILTVADRVYVMRRGRIAESGTAQHFLGNVSRLEELYLSADGIDDAQM